MAPTALVPIKIDLLARAISRRALPELHRLEEEGLAVPEHKAVDLRAVEEAAALAGAGHNGTSPFLSLPRLCR
jgi:hypothetical protein